MEDLGDGPLSTNSISKWYFSMFVGFTSHVHVHVLVYGKMLTDTNIIYKECTKKYAHVFDSCEKKNKSEATMWAEQMQKRSECTMYIYLHSLHVHVHVYWNKIVAKN